MSTKYAISEFNLDTGLSNDIFEIPASRLDEVKNIACVAKDDPTLQYSYPVHPGDVVEIAGMLGQVFEPNPNIFYLLEGYEIEE